MSRALICLGAFQILFSAACAARTVVAAAAPQLVIDESLAAEAQICVPLTLRTTEYSLACITVGDLRALLRSQRSASLQVLP